MGQTMQKMPLISLWKRRQRNN